MDHLTAGAVDHACHLEQAIAGVHAVLDGLAGAAHDLDTVAAHQAQAAEWTDALGESADAQAYRSDAALARARAEQIRLCRAGVLGALRGQPVEIPAQRRPVEIPAQRRPVES